MTYYLESTLLNDLLIEKLSNFNKLNNENCVSALSKYRNIATLSISDLLHQIKRHHMTVLIKKEPTSSK